MYVENVGQRFFDKHKMLSCNIQSLNESLRGKAFYFVSIEAIDNVSDIIKFIDFSA